MIAAEVARVFCRDCEMYKPFPIVIALLFITWAASAIADDLTIESVITDLDKPTIVAVRPGGTAESHEVFIAESGARRIVKILSSEPNRPIDVITGFPGPDARVPQGTASSLQFLDEKTLVVGIDGETPELRLYELAEAASPLTANAAKHRVTPKLLSEESEDVYGPPVMLARTRANDFVADMLLVAIRGGGVWKVPVRANMLGEMSRLESKPPWQVVHPTALTVSEQGYVVVVDRSAGRGSESRLAFLNPINGQVVLQFQLDLSEVPGLAYSPKSGNLYALGKARGNADDAGLFRVDAVSVPGEREITVTKLAEIEQATALSFGPDGMLYVTSRGDNAEDHGGALLKVTGEI